MGTMVAHHLQACKFGKGKMAPACAQKIISGLHYCQVVLEARPRGAVSVHQYKEKESCVMN